MEINNIDKMNNKTINSNVCKINAAVPNCVVLFNKNCTNLSLSINSFTLSKSMDNSVLKFIRN